MSARVSSVPVQPTPGAPSAPRRRRARSRAGKRRTAQALVALLVAAAGLALTSNPASGGAAVISVDRLSGSTRYDTAVEIAEVYADEVEDRGRPSIDTILLTSGEDEHFGCALPAPALSRLYEAPLLLTEHSELPRAVEDFVDDFDIDRAFILGDTDVVSNSVESDLESINNLVVERIEGDDCYETAVEVADRVGEAPGEPGEYLREGRTALVATGEVFADALAAGPLAYTGEHPILLTPKSSLNQQVSQFLRSSDTEHVIILGGPGAVATSVERAIERLGISVRRLYGSDRHATAVRIAQELLGNNAPQSCFEGDEVGLAYGFKSPDAIASGPLLGELCAPLLLTDRDELPRSADDFLESDEYITGDDDGDLRITIFGGTAAVSRGAENDAVNAARLREIRAQITAIEGACHFTVTFTEPVRTSDARVASNYTFGSRPLSSSLARVDAGSGSSTTEAVVIFAGGAFLSGAAVATGCSDPLESRNRVGVDDRAIRGANDRRTVRQVDVTVRTDNTRPNLTVTAPDGGIEVIVEISEPVQETSFDVRFTRDRVDDDVGVFVLDGETRFSIPVPYDELESGDRIEIPGGAVEDFAGNTSLREFVTVRRDATLPRVSRVTVTEPTAREAPYIELDGRYNRSRVSGAMRITALDDGDAFGAAGNDWEIQVEFDSDLESDDPAEITMNLPQQRILVQVGADTETFNVVDDLNRDGDFADLFHAELTDHELSDDSTIEATLQYVPFGSGVSTVDLTLEWTEPVRDCVATERPIRLDRIEIDADANGTGDFALDGFGASSSGVQFVVAPDGNEYIVAGTAACDQSSGVPSGTLVARLSSQRADLLPTLRSRAIIEGGAAYDLRGNPTPSHTLNGLRRP